MRVAAWALSLACAGSAIAQDTVPVNEGKGAADVSPSMTQGAATGKEAPIARPALAGSIAVVGAAANEMFVDRRGALAASGRIELTWRGTSTEARLRWEAISDRNFSALPSRDRWREAWWRWQSDAADVTIGRQLLVQGRTDVLPLQDLVAPRDLTLVALTEAETRLGLPAIRIDAYPSDVLTLSGALIAQDRGHVAPRSLTEVQEALAGQAPRQRDDAGWLRALWRDGPWEVAGSIARGTSPWPSLRSLDDRLSSERPLTTQVSFDGAWSADVVGVVRWESVWSRHDVQGRPGWPARRWTGSIGLDRALGGDATLSVQWISRRDRGFESATNDFEAAIERLNRAAATSVQDDAHWVTATWKKRFGAAQEVESVLLLGTERQRGWVQRWHWSVADGWRLGAKLQWLRGAEGSLLGEVRPARHLIVELRRYL